MSSNSDHGEFNRSSIAINTLPFFMIPFRRVYLYFIMGLIRSGIVTSLQHYSSINTRNSRSLSLLLSSSWTIRQRPSCPQQFTGSNLQYRSSRLQTDTSATPRIRCRNRDMNPFSFQIRNHQAHIGKDAFRTLPYGGGRARAFSNHKSIMSVPARLTTTIARATSSRSKRRIDPLEGHSNTDAESVFIDETSREFLDSIFNSLSDNIFPLFREKNLETIVVIVGVSGGCDSVGLLHALLQLDLPNLNIHAVHFDHRQRGAESDGDRLFVEQLCRDLRVPLHTYYWETSPDDGFSQDSARTWRRNTMYNLLMQTMTLDTERGILMTAHHRDDSIETLILKLLRGVHITNLVGMDPASEPSDTPRAVWARPMLELSKESIVQFLTRQNLSWREDVTNASSKYTRNRVRNELIPLMAEIVGSQQLLEKRLDRLSLQSRQVGEDLRQRARDYLEESGCCIQQFILPPSSQLMLVHRDALHLWSKQQGVVISNDHLLRICNQLEMFPRTLQWTLQIGEGWSIVRKGTILCIFKDDAIEHSSQLELAPQQIEWSPLASGNDTVDGAYTQLVLRVDPSFSDNSIFTISTASHMKNCLFLPGWRNSPVKLKDFLRGQKIPLHLRDQVPVLLHDDEHLVAVHVNGQWEVDSAFQQGSVCIALSLPSITTTPT